VKQYFRDKTHTENIQRAYLPILYRRVNNTEVRVLNLKQEQEQNKTKNAIP